MSIIFSCHQCERKFTVGNELAGRKTKCLCGLILTVPDDSELVLPPVLSKPYSGAVSPDNPFITPQPKPVVGNPIITLPPKPVPPVQDNPFTPPPKSIQDIKEEVHTLAKNTKKTIGELEGIGNLITFVVISTVISVISVVFVGTLIIFY